DARFKALGGELTDEQIATADRYAQQMMDQYGDTYTANGIGLDAGAVVGSFAVQHSVDVRQGILCGLMQGTHLIRDCLAAC
ncbi:hypothetical protein ACSTB0_13715, partial [Faecalibacterium wellingii]